MERYAASLSPNLKKCGPKITRIRTLLTLWSDFKEYQKKKKLLRHSVEKLCSVTVGRYFKSCGWKQIICSKVCSSIAKK